MAEPENGEPEQVTRGWVPLERNGIREHVEVTIPIRDYFEALRHADREMRETDRRYAEQIHEADLRFRDERDRRYTEVKNAEEKALAIKEKADERALGLSAETQKYKDEKANQLREQISSERNLYVTRGELEGHTKEMQAQLKPVADWASAQQGRAGGQRESRDDQRLSVGQILQALTTLAALITLVIIVFRK